MIDPGVVAKYRKVLAHVQRGEGHERANAQRTLDKMEAKYPGVGAQARQAEAHDAQEKATADWARRAAQQVHVRHAHYPSTGPTGAPVDGGPHIPPAGVTFWIKFIQDAIEDASTIGGPPPSAKLFVQSIDFGPGFVAGLKKKAAESFADWADDQIAARIATLNSSPRKKKGHHTMARLTEKEVIARLEDEGIEAFHCTDDDNGDELIQLNILIPLDVWEGIKEYPASFFAVVEEQLEADDGGPDEEEGDGDPEELDGDLDEEAEVAVEDDE